MKYKNVQRNKGILSLEATTFIVRVNVKNYIYCICNVIHFYLNAHEKNQNDDHYSDFDFFAVLRKFRSLNIMKCRVNFYNTEK